MRLIASWVLRLIRRVSYRNKYVLYYCGFDVGTAGLPHVIVRYFTVKNVRAVRVSAAWTLVFIAVIYLTAPAIGAFARVNLIKAVNEVPRVELPGWFEAFEQTEQLTWTDMNGDGCVQYRGPSIPRRMNLFLERI